MDDIVTTGADLSASVDLSGAYQDALANAGEAEDATASPEPETAETTEAAAEPEIAEPGEVEEPAEPVEETPAEETPAEKPAAEKEQLPDGVEVRQNAEGKKKYYLPEQVYQDHKSAVELRGQLAELIGEEPTLEALKSRHEALLAQERLYTDLLSGDAKAQGEVLAHFMDQARIAVENGETAADPMISFARVMTDLFAKHNPQADSAILTQSTRRVFDDIYSLAAELRDGRTDEELATAAQAGDRSAQRAVNLLRSVQHLDNEIFKTYKKAGDVPARTSDPLAQREAALRSREEQIAARDTAAANDRWTQWNTDWRRESRTAVDKVIDTALTDAKKLYAKYPDALKQAADRLRSKVVEGIQADKAWIGLLEMQTNKAHRAVSDQYRQQVATNIVRQHENKASLIVKAHRDAILREAVGTLKAQSDATHERRTAAQQHAAPGAGGSPVRRGIAPVPSNRDYEVATKANLLRDLDAIFAAQR